MKEIFKEDIQAVKTALKGKDLRPNVKIELQELLQSFETQFKNNENTGLSAVAVGEKEKKEAFSMELYEISGKIKNATLYLAKNKDAQYTDKSFLEARMLLDKLLIKAEKDEALKGYFIDWIYKPKEKSYAAFKEIIEYFPEGLGKYEYSLSGSLSQSMQTLIRYVKKLDKEKKKEAPQTTPAQEKETPKGQINTFEEFKELVVRYKVGIHYFVGYKNNRKFNSDFRYHQKLGKGYHTEKPFFVEAMRKEAIFWCKDFDGANCNAKSVLQEAYKVYLEQNNLTETTKTAIDKPKTTPAQEKETPKGQITTFEEKEEKQAEITTFEEFLTHIKSYKRGANHKKWGQQYTNTFKNKVILSNYGRYPRLDILQDEYQRIIEGGKEYFDALDDVSPQDAKKHNFFEVEKMLSKVKEEPKTTPTRSQIDKAANNNMTLQERIDALKATLKYANKQQKPAILSRIDGLKTSLKYSK